MQSTNIQDTIAKKNRELLLRSGAEYVVAFGTQIVLNDPDKIRAAHGRSVLVAGDSVFLEWIEGGEGAMRQLIASGLVLARKDAGLASGPKYALSVAIGAQSVMVRRGIIGPGEELKEGDFDSPDDLERLVRKGLVIRLAPRTTKRAPSPSKPPEAA